MRGKVLILYICLNFRKIIAVVDLNSCVVPPLKCPNINITFWLYTRKNEGAPHEISINNPDTISSAPWVKDAPIKVLIHGYTGDKDFSPNTEIRPAYLKSHNYNILSIDYKPLALEPCYIQAVKNVELVGMCTAQIIDEIVLNHGFHLSDFHPIGFSLGGQVLGYIANYIKSGKMDRITALDPALPLFVTADITKKVDRSDAKFVDVLHTNVLSRGKLEPSGHIDFYANWGFLQPGCPDTNASISSCSHARAPLYYAESIDTDVGFYGRRCLSWFLMPICNILKLDEELVLFGEYVPREIFYKSNTHIQLVLKNDLAPFTMEDCHSERNQCAARVHYCNGRKKGVAGRVGLTAEWNMRPKFGLFYFETNSVPPYSKGKT